MSAARHSLRAGKLHIQGLDPLHFMALRRFDRIQQRVRFRPRPRLSLSAESRGSPGSSDQPETPPPSVGAYVKPRKSRTKQDRFRALRRKLFEDDGSCWFCGVTLELEQATLDHFHPKKLGGKDTRSNFRLACPDCNFLMADVPPEYLVCIPQRGIGMLFVWELDLLEMGEMDAQIIGFNYDLLTPGTARAEVRQYAESIHVLSKRPTRNVVQIGLRLTQARNVLGPNLFCAWLKAEL